MVIVWDEPKRLTNLDKHGLDFAELDLEFFRLADITPAKRGRFLAIGMFLDAIVVSVVFTPRGTEAVSIVSMRPASRKERKMR